VMGIIFAIGCKSPFQERLLLARQSQLTPSRFYTIEFTSPLAKAREGRRIAWTFYLQGRSTYQPVLFQGVYSTRRTFDADGH
jgi:hypothetical protein